LARFFDLKVGIRELFSIYSNSYCAIIVFCYCSVMYKSCDFTSYAYCSHVT